MAWAQFGGAPVALRVVTAVSTAIAVAESGQRSVREQRPTGRCVGNGLPVGVVSPYLDAHEQPAANAAWLVPGPGVPVLTILERQ
ncbi:hypothetical protein GCM10028771_02750 [Nocardioides marmoraquaticus]